MGTKLTPPKVAKRYGVSPDKIVALIRSGELPAIDISNPGAKRPRFLIDESDIETFEERRRVQPTPKPRRRRPQGGVTEYF